MTDRTERKKGSNIQKCRNEETEKTEIREERQTERERERKREREVRWY